MLKFSGDVELINVPNEGDAGYDIKTPLPFSLQPGERKKVDIPIQWQPPSIPKFIKALCKKFVGLEPVFVGEIKPRSGLAIKSGIDTLAGVIDDTYRGNFGIVLLNTSDKEVYFHVNDKIAQLVIKVCWTGEFKTVTTLDETKRGSDGWGSTGK